MHFDDVILQVRTISFLIVISFMTESKTLKNIWSMSMWFAFGGFFFWWFFKLYIYIARENEVFFIKMHVLWWSLISSNWYKVVSFKKKKKCSKDKFQLTHGPHRYLEFLYMNKFGLLKPRPKEIVYYDNICTKSVKQLMHDKCIFLSIVFNLSFNMSSFYLSNLEILK